ncbi:hypothetical protein KCV07_g5887, partial [Aureobasidium melanogenum]
MPSKRLKPRRPCQRHLLPWGYDAPKKDNISLDAFIEIITKEDGGSPSEIKNVLMYWDRGDLERGDEAKLKEMNINSNLLFGHVLDSQEWFRDRYPKGYCGNEKHNLGEAAQMMGVEMTTQADLDEMTDTEREYKFGAMRHCGGGDSDLTVRVTAELLLLRIAELNAADGRCRKINGKYCFWGLDFEGGGHTGQGTTEIGLTKLWASDLEELGQNYWSAVSSRHAIILESFNDHLCRDSQEGKIAIDNRHPETYPRWNFRGGPNTTEKCAYIFQASRNTPPQVFNVSIDSEIISQTNMAWWIIQQIPPRYATDEQVTDVNPMTAPLNANTYPMIVIVDSQNESHALRLTRRQRQVPPCRSRPHQAKKRRPCVEEEDWWMDALKLEQLYWRGFRMRPSVDTAYSDRCQALTTTLSYYLPLDELSFQPKNVDKWLTAGFITPHNSALLSIRTPTLAAAVDTLILTQAAARTHDDRLAQQAIKKYTISIASLRESIAEIGNYERNDVLLAIFMLQLGETFSPISRPGELLPHIDGAARILEYEGPRRLSSSYDTALFTHARQHAILGGLLRREHTFFNQPQWLAVCQSAPTSNHLTRLLDIGSPVPGLLAETDKVGSNIRSEHFIYELLRKLDCSYEEIVTWIEEFCSSMVHEIGTTINPKEMEAYSEEVDGDPITLPILKFASFRTAWRITLGWTFQYTILQAIHDILTIRVDVVYKHKASELESEMFRVITNLSMVIPQLFAKRFGAIGRAAIMLPLTILTEFYSSRGGARELNWCRKIAKAVNNPREGLKPIWMHEWKEGVHVHARKS